jgi:cellulose synthase operon protein YhjQ
MGIVSPEGIAIAQKYYGERRQPLKIIGIENVSVMMTKSLRSSSDDGPPQSSSAADSSGFSLPLSAASSAGVIERIVPFPSPGPKSLSPLAVVSTDGGQPEEQGWRHWFALRASSGQARNSDTNPGNRKDGFIEWHASIPGLAVFSLVGGVGKTSIVAGISRALSSAGERAVLVDTAAYGMLPFYFGARDSPFGSVRVFSQGEAGSAPVHLFSYNSESGIEFGTPSLLDKMIGVASEADRLILDIATASTGMARELFHLIGAVLVPIAPDLRSVVSIASVERIFEQIAHEVGRSVKVFFVLNHFDSSSAMHRELKDKLRRQLGESLLPIEIRRHDTVNEALAAGMTVLDYAPNASVSQDYRRLADWVGKICGPAAARVRWSEV